MNLSKSGGSLSFGRRGARYTVGARGRRSTVGIPGTGLFYSTTSGSRRDKGKKKSAALRRKRDRFPELLRTLRYERALVYDDLGQSKRARSEFEKLYAEKPDYEGVASRLGLAFD